ncbi:DNA polymerase Y family protein [Verrucomicrobium sp. BvORR106]|uniref:DNA polymerase Y family protein n=1 Tax=Verrucomicrobium sp. BvORR106 TaxID=1403819 RepID=UPI0005714F23|nr:DNA polymerase Y family protein [Verrucomicrobium sp. BvORR106]
MHAAVLIPAFQLQALAHSGFTEPVALLDAVAGSSSLVREQASVLHLNAVARSFQVHPGMTASMAQARCAAIQLLYRDAAAEGAAQQRLLECASNQTPYYESTLPGLCVLDLSSLKGIRGSEQAWGETLRQDLARHRLSARIGFARHADLAVLAAHTARPIRIIHDTPGNENENRRFLNALPLSVLNPTWQTAEVFALWGIKTVGQLCQLPRSGVTQRLGREGMLLWDLANGGHERLLRLVRPVPGYRMEEDFEHRVECLEPLLFILRRHLQHLCDRLGADWKVAAAAALELRFEDRTSHRRDLRVAEPTRDVDLLFRVIHTALEGFTAAAPICGLTLELQPITPSGCQSHLFERTLKDPNRFAETLSHLEALVGTGNVGRVKLLPSRRLDAFAVTPFFDLENGSSSPSPATAVTIPSEEMTCVGLPLRRLRPAPPAEVFLVNEKPAAFRTPHYSQVITACDGPWLISGNWWDATQAWRREIWVVTGEKGALFQLARQRNGEWILEGLLG